MAAYPTSTAHYVALDLAQPTADQTLWEEAEKRGLAVERLIN